MATRIGRENFSMKVVFASILESLSRAKAHNSIWEKRRTESLGPKTGQQEVFGE